MCETTIFYSLDVILLSFRLLLCRAASALSDRCPLFFQVTSMHDSIIFGMTGSKHSCQCWRGCMIYQVSDHASMGRYSRHTSKCSTSAAAVAADLTKLKANDAVVVADVVRVNSMHAITEGFLIGEQDLLDMAQEVRARAISDATRRTEDLGDHGTAALSRVSPV